jgi:glutamine amidotransferase-like uncharacterized protein
MILFKQLLLNALTAISTWIEGSPLLCHQEIAPLVSTLDRNVIYIYNGPGTASAYVWGATVTLAKILGDGLYRFEHIGPDEVKNRQWVDDAALFLMPGGADLPYLEHLTPDGNEAIRHYVANGGSYMGFCAGSYYAGDEVVFAPNTDMEVIGPRPLRFFEGTVYGPVLAPYDYTSTSGSRIAKISLNDSCEATENTIFCYYNGGGAFINATHTPYTEIIGFYENAPLNFPEGKAYAGIDLSLLTEGAPAVIETSYEAGKAILVGCHPEMPTAFLKASYWFTRDPHIGEMLPILESKNSERLAFMALLCKRLGLQTKPF